MEIVGNLFKGYGWFILAIMLAIIIPELTHQHLNYSSFPFSVRRLSRYGIMFIGFGILFERVVGSVIE